MFTGKIKNATWRLYRSVWLFPVVLLVLLTLLTSLKISGSSIGAYYRLFYGNAKDPALIVNHPQNIRSDEWLVNSQMAIAQANAHYSRINPNIGSGEDVSVLADAPYKEWSVIFRPQQLGFLVMPFDFAFAFRWWFMAFLLMTSCYAFVLSLLPKKRLFAALLSVGLFFMPFIQWWYLHGTLASIYWALFGGAILVQLMKTGSWRRSLIWGGLLVYVATTFALVLYPPFQIPCALAMTAFAAGYLIGQFGETKSPQFLKKIAVLVGSILLAGLIVLVFLFARSGIIQATQNTAYPGKRIQPSGGFSVTELMSSHLDGQLEFASRAMHYPQNQSEASSFILLLPFLLLPSFFLLYKYYKSKKRLDWPLLTVCLTFLLFLAWLFVPHLGVVGKLTQLQLVPHRRLLIGLGVLNLLQIVLFTRLYGKTKNLLFTERGLFIYIGLILAAELIIGLHVKDLYPGFIGLKRVAAYALPIPLIIYLLLKKRFEWAAAVLLLFALFMTFRVNPLYRGTSVLTNTPLSAAIKTINANDKSAWASEHFLLENFAYMNGAHSFSGVYMYPQLSIWRDADPRADQAVYNRYAHSVFVFDRDPSKTIATTVELGSLDTIAIKTEPCSPFLKNHNIRYLLVASPLNPADGCARLLKTVSYPALVLYIYHLD